MSNDATSDDDDTDEPDNSLGLLWGETPWDRMTRDEVIREAQRLFAACGAMKGALAMNRFGNEASPFWSLQGTAGRALAMGEHALAEYGDSDQRSENIYRSFFRAAEDLLFHGIGCFSWYVCECGTMTGSQPDGTHDRCCSDCAHKAGWSVASMRPITWDDVKPTAIKVSPATCLDVQENKS